MVGNPTDEVGSIAVPVKDRKHNSPARGFCVSSQMYGKVTLLIRHEVKILLFLDKREAEASLFQPTSLFQGGCWQLFENILL